MEAAVECFARERVASFASLAFLLLSHCSHAQPRPVEHGAADESTASLPHYTPPPPTAAEPSVAPDALEARQPVDNTAGPGTPLAHYSFDDCTAQDVSGHGHDGVVMGAPVCVRGPIGQAFEFDGAHDYIAIPPIASGDALRSQISVTGWIKASGFKNSVGSWITVMTIGNTSSLATAFSVIYEVDRSGRFLPHTRLTDPNGRTHLARLATAAGQDNQWLFFAWTFQRGQLKIYRDGELAATANAGFPQLPSAAMPIDLGRDLPGQAEFLKGSLDDVRIYDYELSAAEIRTLRALGSK